MKYLLSAFLTLSSIMVNAQYVDYILDASWANEPIATTFTYYASADINITSAALDIITTPLNGNRSIKVSIRWKPQYSGSVVIHAFFSSRGPCCDPVGENCGACNSENKYTTVQVGCPVSFTISASSASAQKAPFTNTLNIDSQSIGGDIYQWYVKNPGAVDFIIISGATGTSYNATINQVGQYTYQCRITNSCGIVNSNNVYLTGLVSCSGDVASASVSPALIPVGNGSALKIEKGNTYTLNISGVTDFNSHYDINNDGGNDITYNAVNKTFTPNNDIGSYTFTINPKSDGVDRSTCPVFQPIKLWAIGSQQTVINSPCTIYLPSQICTSFNLSCVTPPDPATDFILRNFTYKVTSNRAIVVQPGVVLQAGALLSLSVVPAVVDADDDFRNYSDLTHYDDAGNITGQSRAYFNNVGINIQTQVKNLTSGIILCTETKYDMLDRPALTTLAAPVWSLPVTAVSGCSTDVATPALDMYFRYKENFITAGGGVYDATKFDGTREQNPDAVDGTVEGTLGWYYSDNNKTGAVAENRFIESGVAATSYPYSRNLYYNDGTNRLKSSTLPGDYHKAGSGKYSVADTKVLTTADAVLSDYLNIRNTKVLDGSNDSIKRPSVGDMAGNVYIEQSTDMNGLLNLIYKNRERQTLISLVKDNNGTELQRSYIFYDDLGRMLASISPNGYEQLHKSIPISYDDIDKTTLKYDGQGRLAETTSIDGGTSKFVYRTDGSIRFSQNAEQALSGKFSYTNYDEYDRPYESGVFTPVAGSAYTFGSSQLKAAAEIGGLNESLAVGGAKSEIVTTHYDLPDTGGPLPDAGFTIGTVAWTEKTDENSNVFKTWYSYDEQGRLLTMVQRVPGLGDKTLTYKYHPNGQVQEVAYQVGQPDAFYHVYTYDADARLAKVFTGTIVPQYDNTNTPANLTEQAAYTYYKHGPLKNVNISKGLQVIDYTYTVQGWLKAINDPANPGTGAKTDVFALQLDYFSGDYTTGNSTGTAHYDGLVRQQTWRTAKPDKTPEVNAYSYTYDNRYQLSAAVWGTVTNGTFAADASKQYAEEAIDYDANGNIRNLIRYGAKVGTAAPVLNDFKGDGGTVPATATGYRYAANSNRLSSVKGYASYSYNDIGQMTKQTLADPAVTRFYNYNSHGLTASIKEGTNTLINYAYDEGGFAYKKERYDRELHTLAGTDYYVRDASGNILAIYHKPATGDPIVKERPLYGGNRLGAVYYNSSVNGSGETVVNTTTIYDLTDHLGSTRARFAKNPDNTIDVVSYADYYPFGLTHSPEFKGSIPSRYGYQGEFSEHNDVTGLNEFELRQYDAVTGRWNSLDPYGQYPSGYVGMGNNPVNGVDPDGGWFGGGGDGDKKLDGVSVRMPTDTPSDPTGGKGGSFFSSINYGSSSTSGVVNNLIVQQAAQQATQQAAQQAAQQAQQKLTVKCPTCLNPNSVGNLWGDYYTGGNNPKSYNGSDNYSLTPKNLRDRYSYIHDKSYDKIGAIGFMDVVNNHDAIDADLTFGKSQLGLGARQISRGQYKEGSKTIITGVFIGGFGVLKLGAKYSQGNSLY